MLKPIESLKRLHNSRRGAVAVIVALVVPTLLIGTAMTLETASIGIRQAQLQTAADAIAGAAREKLDANQPTPAAPNNQTGPVTEAVRIAGLNNMGAALAAGSLKTGWWKIPMDGSADGAGAAAGTGKVDRFGDSTKGQTGDPFSNAIRVTLKEDHKIAMGALLGVPSIKLAATSTSYKCSNYDYPYTLVPDDPNPPLLPAMYMSYATTAHPDANTSYYYLQKSTGAHNPVIKFYSPYDDQDVSFVITMSTGQKLQVDTYCRGTYLVAPASFDWSKQTGPIIGTIQRGSTNNSLDVYQNQGPYKFDSVTTTYYVDAKHNFESPDLDPTLVHTTKYPNASGVDQYWASESTPTPDRRSKLVR